MIMVWGIYVIFWCGEYILVFGIHFGNTCYFEYLLGGFKCPVAGVTYTYLDDEAESQRGGSQNIQGIRGRIFGKLGGGFK